PHRDAFSRVRGVSARPERPPGVRPGPPRRPHGTGRPEPAAALSGRRARASRADLGLASRDRAARRPRTQDGGVIMALADGQFQYRGLVFGEGTDILVNS